MSALNELGEKLLTKTGIKETSELLAGKKYIITYFSGHWCPPCQRFTPELVKFYQDHKDQMNFEIVFISLDRNDNSFNEYYNTMPWPAIPFHSNAREKFCQKYGGEGIPELVVFTSEGKVITRDAVQKVMEEPTGFPWPPPTWEDCLGPKLITQDGTEHDTNSIIKGKTIGVYCSAHWCGPCRTFTPQLAEFYKAYKAKDPNFEIIFCSHDKGESEMISYFKEHGSYYAIPFGSPARTLMQKYVGSQGIPAFAVYDDEGKILNANARAKVSQGADAILAGGWKPPMVGNLKDGMEAGGSDINSTAAILIRCEGCDDDEQQSIIDALQEVSNKHTPEPGKTPELIFFYSTDESAIVKQIGQLTEKSGSKRCSVLDDEPLMLYFDIPSGGAFYESPLVSLTPESVEQFIIDVRTGSATRLQLSK